MIRVVHTKTEVGTIARQNATAPGYEPQRPWLLTPTDRAPARYTNLNAARYAAKMAWPGCHFSK